MQIKNLNKTIYYYIIPIIIAIFNALIILIPNLVISSAQNGLKLWFNNIIPSLLPFLIGTNLLIKLGFIDFLGTLLEPLMKKLFNVSGNGAFALILGMFSGYPIGAKITTDLYKQNKLTKVEAQRLLGFTNNSGPLFILGTVGIGMFKSSNLGYLMLIIHYLGAISTGILLKYYKKNDKFTNIVSENYSLKTAFKNLKKARQKENKSFGEILSESVKNALEVIAVIGGFVILFSVIAEILKTFKIFEFIGQYFFPNNLSSLANGFFIGIIEMTNGCNILSFEKTAFAAILAIVIISWSGFSIHAQTISIIGKTDLNIGFYFISKIIHSLLSFIYALISLPLIKYFIENSISQAFNYKIGEILKISNYMFFYVIILILSIAIFSTLHTYTLKYKIKHKK